MTPEFVVDLKIGDSLNWEVNITDDAGGAIDLTPYSIKCQARSKNDNTVILFTLSTADSTVGMSDAINGNITLTIENTSEFLAGPYLVDIKRTLGNLSVSSAIFELNVYQGITE